MELRHLRSVLILAEELHFGRAAERLGIVQSALSRQLQQLETELQFQLFKRSAHAVALTDAGRHFMEQIGPAIQKIDEAAADAANFASAKRGRVRVGSCGTLSTVLIPGVLENLNKESPDVRIEVRELSTAEQIRTLHTGEIDVGLVYLPINDPSLIVRRVLTVPLVVMVQSGSELANRESIRLGELAEQRFLSCPRDREGGYHEFLIGQAAKAGFRPEIAMEIDGTSTAVALVERGRGVKLVPRFESWPTSNRVRCVPIENPELVVEIALVWRRDNMSSLLRWFIDSVVESLRTTTANEARKLVA